MVGDISTAEKVYIAPFDTAARTFMPQYQMYPLDDEKRKNTDLKAMVFDRMILLVAMLIVFYLSWRIAAKLVLSLILTVAVAIVYGFLLNNRYTFNRSAALALMSTLAAKKKDEKIAYVFLDKCADSYYGLRMFLVKNKEILNKAKDVVFLDSLASGEYLVFASRRKGNIRHPENCDNVRLDDDCPIFFKTISNLTMVFTADRKNDDYVITNIRKSTDRKVDVKRLKELLEIW